MPNPNTTLRTLVVGAGNPLLKDDGAGLHAIAGLRELGLPDHVRLDELGGGGLELVEMARGFERLEVIDAIRTGAAPGTLHILSLDALGELRSRPWRPTAAHDVGLAEAIEIGRRLLGDEFPSHVDVLAVEVEDVTPFGTECTESVKKAVAEAVAWVVEAVAGGGAQPERVL